MVNIILWIVQIFVALMFLYAGYMKAFQPLDKLAKTFKWVPSFPPAFVRFLGICELLGAIGIVLPPLTHIWPWLALAAAIGFILAAGGGIVVHALRREYNVIVLNIVLVIFSAFIIYGRLVLTPF